MTRFKWQALFSIFAVFAIMTIAVACGDDDDDGGTAASPTGGGTAPTAGGELTVHYLEFQSFDPHFSSFSQDIGHETMVFRGLFKLDKDNRPQPEMAASAAAVSTDGKTYTIKIKPDLKWSDGAPLKAKDFVAGLQRTCDPDNAGEYQFILSVVVGCDAYYDPANAKKTAAEKETLRNAVGVKAIDENTVEYKLTDPQPTFAMILALWPTFPMPTHIVKNTGDKWPAPEQLVFNGPFKVQTYKQKDSMVLVRNDAYSGAHKAYLDKLTLKYIENTATANNAYPNGELDIALADTANLDVLKADPKLGKELLSNAKANTASIQMNMAHKPLDNYKVRLALSQSIDRETLNRVVLKLANIPDTAWIPPDVSGVKAGTYDSVTGYNVAAAKKNLADAGYPDGKGMPVLGYTVRDTPAAKATAEFLQQAWKTNLGIDIKIDIVDAPTRSKIFKEETFDLYPGGWNQDYPDPENWVLGLFDFGPPKGTLNHYNCNDPKIDDLIKKAKFNPKNEERLQQYRDIDKLISEGLCGGAPIYHAGQHYLIAPKVKGARENSNSKDYVTAGDWTVEDWAVAK